MSNIIIVEDDPMISEIYEKKFTEAGFNVFCVSSGDKVLDTAKKEKIDIILLDLIIPKMDGFEVIKHLREGNFDKNIKIIAFSNLGEKENREKAMSLGADGFITKSQYKPSELVQEVKRLLGQFGEQTKNEEKRSGDENGNNSEAKDSKKKKILLVEDEEVFIEMFGEKLMQDGYDVINARNGAWGVKEAINGNFDLFIIDMVMPAMTGEEIIAKLKLEEKTKNIPIIVLSASVDDETVKRVEAMGISAFFIKTKITPKELVEKIEEILKI